MSSSNDQAPTPVTWKKGLLDLSAIAIVLVTTLATKFFPSPTTRGFYCNDETIRYPFVPEKISDSTMQAIFYVLGMGVILLTEFILNRKNSSKLEFFTFSLPLWFVFTYTFWVDYVFSELVLATVVGFAKNAVGRLRPNFIDACGPDVDLSDCSIYENNPITEFNCTKGPNINIRQSFPSGHAAMGTFALVYLTIYVQNRWRNGHFKIWKHLFQAALVLAFFGITLSRFVDNLHHTTDLIAGTFLGGLFGYFAAIYISHLNKFKSDENKDEEEPLVKP